MNQNLLPATLRDAGKSMAAIDLRSLAAFRLGAATLLVLDLLLRLRDFTAFYTDRGILPRAAGIGMYETGDAFARDQTWSLHLASGQLWFQLLLFLAALVAAAALLVGYRTRIAAVVSWILLVSLDARNPAVLNSGDVLLRSMLFWSLFLPLGACWSLDHQRTKDSGETRQICSLASLALLLQLALMYFISALFKLDCFTGEFRLHPAWTTEGSAVYYALHCDAYTNSFGIFLRQFYGFTRVATWGTIGLELFGPIIVFLPWQTARIRLATVISFWLFHLGLAATMTIGLFAPICIVCWIVFLPSLFWERLHWVTRLPQIRLGILRCRRWQSAVQQSTWGPRRSRTHLSQRWPRLRKARTVGKNLLVGGLLIYLLLWNVRELDVAALEKFTLPRRFNGLGRILGLDQNWSMFSPIPRTEDGWIVMRGVQRDGKEVNLWNPGEPLPWEKPANVSATYKRQRWRKYLDGITTETSAPHRMYFCDWLQRTWNERFAVDDGQREVVEVQLVQRIELTPPPGKPIPDPVSRILWTWYYE